MNFEEFKKRYEAKLVRAGITIPGPEDDNYKSFQDQMATIYVGIVIFSEYQNEHIAEQLKKQQAAAAQPKIIIPDGIKH